MTRGHMNDTDSQAGDGSQEAPRKGAAGEHILRAYDVDLDKLKDCVVEMGELADAQVGSAIHGMMKRDATESGRVVEQDGGLDSLATTIETLVMELLALRQPVARDLREVIGALKISNDLERIGDLAANISKRSIAIRDVQLKPAFAIPRMGMLARDMIRSVLESLKKRDAALAMSVWERDEELDEMNSSLFRELLTYMMEDPRSISAGTHLLFIAKNIERIGDHATNIAEAVVFMVSGEAIQRARPKRDDSSTIT
jgi:phosphate transport system protein